MFGNLIISICCFSLLSFSQNERFFLSGIIIDSSGAPLPSSSIRVSGTQIGTSCDVGGNFFLTLPKGSYKIIFSRVGYQTRSINIEMLSDSFYVVSLKSSDIQFPEVVVVGEDPAYPIIRAAIVEKKRWIKHLRSFQARVYTKDNLGSDTALVLISEAYSDLYWTKEDSIKESIIYRRQSVNIPPEFQIARAIDFINFNNNSILIWGYTFTGPLADSCFHFYEYSLINEYHERDKKFYRIRVSPKSNLIPLFYGEIIISDSSLALVAATLNPNNVFRIPFIRLGKFQITQHFSLYDSTFWLPLDYSIQGEMNFEYLFVTYQPLLKYNKSVICFEYKTNTHGDDSLLHVSLHSFIPSAQSYDTSYWTNVRLFPLTQLESRSYKVIEDKLSSSTFSSKAILFFNHYKSYIDGLDASYNKTEGLFLGGKSFLSLSHYWNISASIGYGFSDSKFKYQFQNTFLLSNAPSSIGIKIFRNIETFPINYTFNRLINSFSSFIRGFDYYQYYERFGFSIYYSSVYSASIQAIVRLSNEVASSLQNNSRFAFAFIGNNNTFLENLPINNGRLRSIYLEVKKKNAFDNLTLFEEPKNTFEMSIEHSLTGYGSEFNFTQLLSRATVRIPTLGTTRLYNPYLGIYAAGGYTWGITPIQRGLSLESSLSNITHHFAFRTLSPNEFMGNGFYAVHIENNFRNIIFILAGFSNLNADLIFRVATGFVRAPLQLRSAIWNPTINNYVECSIGIGRISNLFRVDLNYGINKTNKYSITLAGLF